MYCSVSGWIPFNSVSKRIRNGISLQINTDPCASQMPNWRSTKLVSNFRSDSEKRKREKKVHLQATGFAAVGQVA